MKHNKILSALLLLLLFSSCEKEEKVEDDSIYKEELFTANAWKLVSAHTDYDLVGSSVIGSIPYAGTGELLDYMEECQNDYELTYLTTKKVQVQTGNDFCESLLSNKTLEFATWSVKDDTLSIEYDQNYIALIQSMYDTNIPIEEQELSFIELTGDKLVLKLEISEDDIEEYASQFIPVVGLTVTGTMTITYTYEPGTL